MLNLNVSIIHNKPTSCNSGSIVFINNYMYVEIKCQPDATEDFIADLIACSTCFGRHYAHHQELKSIIQWLLPVVFRVVVFQVDGLVWSRGLCVRFAGCCSILQTGRITLSSTPDQQLEKPQHEIQQATTTV